MVSAVPLEVIVSVRVGAERLLEVGKRAGKVVVAMRLTEVAVMGGQR